MTDERSITMWNAGTLRVTATQRPDGSVLIYGQDFGHPLCEEYEYWITVPARDVPRLAESLGGAEGADPLDLLGERSDEIVRKGEKTWIEDHGITPEFFNRMGDPRTSDVDRRPRAAAPASWDDIIDRVTGVLDELEAEEYLILTAAGNRFVQVAVQDFALRVESVGDQFLDPSVPWSDDQIAALDALGYQRATHHIEDDAVEREGSPNHWMELPTNTPRSQLATLLMETLRQVHQVSSPQDLTYECMTFLGEHIPQPSLGLARG